MANDKLSPMRCAANVRRAVSQLSRRLRPNLQRDGISMAKLGIIGQIYRAGRITPTEVAAREGVKVQTLTRTLAELEAENWVRREPDAADRRQALLTLTATGKRCLADATRETDAALAETIEVCLSLEERKILLRACALLERLDEAMSGSAGPGKARAMA